MPLFKPIVEGLQGAGHEVLLTARDHAQTVELARRSWPDLIVVGGQSPGGRGAKALTLARRADALRRVAARGRPDVALTHGSYAQLLAARAARIPAITMMDYEHQPANHLSFRLAKRVVVPAVFPERALRRFGASRSKVVRYPGFKEELYLAGFVPDRSVHERLDLDSAKVIAVLRPPPDGALYHRMVNERFEEILRWTAAMPRVQTLVLPRTAEQRRRYAVLAGVVVPDEVMDGCSLLAFADLVVGAGGTMNREAALLGTPTYTVFAGHLAAVDSELIRLGLLRDLRMPGTFPRCEKKGGRPREIHPDRARAIFKRVADALALAAGSTGDAAG